MSEITSRQHPVVRLFKEAARGANAFALLDGWHLLHDALTAGMAVDTVALVGHPRHVADAELIAQLTRSGVSVVPVSGMVMDALSPVRTPSGVAALVRRRDVDLPQVLSPVPPLVVVMIDMQDPGNVGAVIRSAEAGGATGVILAGASADPWGWKALRAAMGSTFRLPVLQKTDVADVCTSLRRHGVTLLATAPRDGRDMHNLDLRNPIALLLGSEGRGLEDRVVLDADHHISIPMQSPVESLNVAVAAGVLVYEARRQRTAKSL